MPGPVYAYVGGVPLPANPINFTQPILLSNFQAINELININHVTFNTPDNFGKHKFVSMPEQGADPATTVNEAALYTKVGAVSAVTELFWRRENNGTVINMTEASLAAPTGWTRLPSGLLMKWSAQAMTSGVTTVNFNGGGAFGPNFTTVYSLQATPYINVTTWLAFINVLPATVMVTCSSSPTTFYFLLIGV